jgi:O-methyltransferase domain/Dimerisation domain
MQSDIDSSSRDVPSPEHLRELYLLLGGYRVSQAIYVVAKLGIPDLLAGGPHNSDALAQATGTHADALYRILRFLAGVGLFDELAPRQFGLTALGAGLRSDAVGSMRPTVLMHLDPAKWQSWGHLLHSVQTGGTSFHQIEGVEIFDYLKQHPDASGIFQQAMTSNTAWSGTAITRAYDFSGIGRLVDVGGGHGLLLATVLQAYPEMRGVLFDRSDVIAGAWAVLERAGIADRCEVVGGDFFEEVPAGGDAYLLRQILHDWDDARAAKILQTCRRAMNSVGKVLVVESVIVSDYRQALPVLQLDLEMLVNYGGRQRTEADYRELFAVAGLRMGAVVPLGDLLQLSVFEGILA